MRFVYPEFLYALAVLAIPVIIHLFNFRRYKKVYFSNVAFLKEVKEQTQSRSRLKHLLVLISRLLALTALVLAFAQPYIPGSENDELKGEKVISVYIDNSFSMEAEGQSGLLLDMAKRRAREIASEYGSSDRFQLLTNDFEGFRQRLISKEEFLDQVEELQISPVSRKLSEVLIRQTDLIRNEESKGQRLIWISDFQKSTCDLSSMSLRETPKVICVPLQAQQRNNIYIDTVWFATPVRQLGAQEKLMVRVRNVGETAVENASLRLDINGTQKSISVVTLDAGSYCDSALYFTNTSPGVQRARVNVGDAKVTFDDDWFFAYTVEEQVNILSVKSDLPSDTSASIASLFSKDPFYRLQSVPLSRVDFSSLGGYRLIILNEVPQMSGGFSSELNNYIKAGGNVLVFPSIRSDLSSWNNFFTTVKAAGFTGSDTSSNTPEKIDPRNPFFAGMFEKDPNNIDLPRIKFRFTTEGGIFANKSALWRTRTGDDFISSYAYGKGKLIVCTVPLHEKAGNFSRHALFVPTVLRIAEWSQNSAIRAQLIGQDQSIDIRLNDLPADASFEMSDENREQTFVPEMRNNGGYVQLYAHGQVNSAGNYTIRLGDKELDAVGYNYDRKESDLACYSTEELQKAFEESGLKEFTLIDAMHEDAPLSIEAIDHSTEYWKLCILMALLFLLIEVLLLRLMKN